MHAGVYGFHYIYTGNKRGSVIANAEDGSLQRETVSFQNPTEKTSRHQAQR